MLLGNQAGWLGRSNDSLNWYRQAQHSVVRDPGFHYPVEILPPCGAFLVQLKYFREKQASKSRNQSKRHVHSPDSITPDLFVEYPDTAKLPQSGASHYLMTNELVHSTNFSKYLDFEVADYQKILALHGQSLALRYSDPPQAHRLCQAALFQSHRLSCLPLENTLLAEAGRFWKEESNYRRAAFYLEQAMVALDHTAWATWQAGYFDRVDPLRWQAAYLSQELGNIYYLLGEHNRALGYYRRALAHARGYPQTSTETRQWLQQQSALLHAEMAGAYMALRAREQAAGEVAQATTAARKVENVTDRGEALSKIAEVNTSLGNLKEARSQCEETLRIAHDTRNTLLEASTRYRLAKIESREGHSAKALKQHQLSFQLASESEHQNYLAPSYMATSLSGIGGALWDLGRYQEAFHNYERSRQISNRNDFQIHEMWALACMGAIRKEQNRLVDAKKYYKGAIAILEQLGGRTIDPSLQISLFSDHLWFYDGLAECLLDEGRTEEAWQVVERARARKLSDVVRSGWGPLEQMLTPAQKDKRAILQNRISALRLTISGQKEHSTVLGQESLQNRLARQLAGAQAKLREWEQQIYFRASNQVLGSSPNQVISLHQALSVLPNDKTVVIQYAILDDTRLVAYTLRREGKRPLQVFDLPVDLAQLSKVARKYVDTVVGEQESRRQATQLYSWLIKPLQTRLRGVRHAIVIPDGDLWMIPFQALRERSDGPPLIKQFAVSYAPSMGVLWQLKQKQLRQKRNTGRPSLLAMAPFADSPGDNAKERSAVKHNGQPGKQLAPFFKINLTAFETLTATTREISTVRHKLGAMNTPLLNSQATESQFKKFAAKYRMIHLATHGEFHSEDPMSSFVALAPDPGTKGEDGFLQAREIAYIYPKMQTDLVVLSACESAQGEVLSGEGLMGLNWALFAAGSSSNLLSQWKVNDISTAQLMERFYDRLSKGDSKADALRKAQIFVLEHVAAEPYHWAPFVLVGLP